MRITTLGASALTVAALTLGHLPPASADTLDVEDANDISHGVDLLSVNLAHNTRNVVVTTTHANLRPSFRSGSAGTVYLDTDAADPGPEFVFVGGYFDGTDYQFLEADGFGRRKWGPPVEGDYRMRLDYDQEQVRMRISRDAIGSPAEVRVAVNVSGTRRDGTGDGLDDWLGERRSFTEWVVQ